MKFLRKNYDREYDIHLKPFGEEVGELDRYVFKKIDRDTHELFKKAETYIGEIIDFSKPLFEGGLILNAIQISGVDPRVYTIEIECYFEHDDHMYWSVTFDLSLLRADTESVGTSHYWPIECKRSVE